MNEDTHSGRSTTPVEAWRWQKRFFVYSDSMRKLFYFKGEPP